MTSPRTPGMKSSTSYSWWKFSSEKIIFDWVRNGEPTFWNEEIQNTHYLSRNESLNLKDCNCHKIFIGQIKFNVRGKFVSRIEYEESSSSGKLRRKLPRIWRIENALHLRGKIWKTSEDRKNFLRSMIRNHVRWVYYEIKYEDYKNYGSLLKIRKSSMIRDSPSSCDSAYVPHQLLITSSSRKPSCDIGMLRNTQEDMSIPGNVFDCQHARRHSDELHNDSNNLATLSAILRTEGIEKIESEEPLQSIPISCFSMRARQMSRRCKMSCVCDWPCRGYWDLYSRHDNTELSLLGDASANFPDQAKFQSWIVNFQVEVCTKARIKRKGTKFSHRWEDWRMFSAEDCWVLLRRDICSFRHGTPWDYVETSGETQEDLT